MNTCNTCKYCKPPASELYAQLGNCTFELPPWLYPVIKEDRYAPRAVRLDAACSFHKEKEE